MKTFWDLTDRERAELDPDQVRYYENVELMSAGVLEPLRPDLEPVPNAPKPTRDVVVVRVGGYRLLDVGFTANESAREFLRQLETGQALVIGSEYVGGKSIPVIEKANDLRLVVESAFTAEEKAESSIAVRKASEVAERNRKLQEDYDASVLQRDAVLSKLRDELRRCQETGRRLGRIRATFAEYLDTAGDPSVALRFLVKAFGGNDVALAFAWRPALTVPEGWALREDASTGFPYLVELTAEAPAPAQAPAGDATDCIQ